MTVTRALALLTLVGMGGAACAQEAATFRRTGVGGLPPRPDCCFYVITVPLVRGLKAPGDDRKFDLPADCTDEVQHPDEGGDHMKVGFFEARRTHRALAGDVTSLRALVSREACESGVNLVVGETDESGAYVRATLMYMRPGGGV